MERLQDVLRRALSEREPTAAEWDTDFAELERKLRRRAPIAWRYVVPAAAVTALVLFTTFMLPAPRVSPELAPMQVYLRVGDEPEESALSIQLTVHSGVQP